MSVVANVAINVDSRGAVGQLKAVQQGAVATDKAFDKLNATTAAAEGKFKVAANGVKYFTDATGRARAENGRFLSSSERAAAGLKAQGDAAQQAAAKIRGLSGAMEGFQGAMAAAAPYIAIAAGIAAAAGAALKFSNEIDRNRQQLTLFTKDVGVTNQIIAQLKVTADATSLGLPGLLEATKTLAAYGVSAKNAGTATKMLGDLALGDSEKLQRFAVNLGQISSIGKAYTVDLKQFAMAGIPIFEALSKVMGKSTSEVLRLAEQGQVTYPIVVKAIAELTKEGASFYNGAEKGGTDLDRSLNQLTGAFENLQTIIGTAVGPTAVAAVLTLKDAVDGVLLIVKGLSNEFKYFSGLIGKSDFGHAIVNEFKFVKKYLQENPSLMMALNPSTKLLGPVGEIIGPLAQLAKANKKETSGATTNNEEVARQKYLADIAKQNTADVLADKLKKETEINGKIAKINKDTELQLGDARLNYERQIADFRRSTLQRIADMERTLQDQRVKANFDLQQSNLKLAGQGQFTNQTIGIIKATQAGKSPAEIGLLEAARDSAKSLNDAAVTRRQIEFDSTMKKIQLERTLTDFKKGIEREIGEMQKSYARQTGDILTKAGTNIQSAMIKGAEEVEKIMMRIGTGMTPPAAPVLPAAAQPTNQQANSAAAGVGRVITPAMTRPTPLNAATQGPPGMRAMVPGAQSMSVDAPTNNIRPFSPATAKLDSDTGVLKRQETQAAINQILGEQVTKTNELALATKSIITASESNLVSAEQKNQVDQRTLDLMLNGTNPALAAQFAQNEQLNAQSTVALEKQRFTVMESLKEKDLAVAQISARKELIGTIDEQIAKQPQVLEGLNQQAVKQKEISDASAEFASKQESIKNLVQGIGASIEGGIVGAIDGAITGAKSLQESLADILKDIGKMLISFGIKSLLGGIDIGGTKVFGGGKAAGGPVNSNSTYMVGEKGPELFVPSTAGTIIPADATAAMARYQRQGGGDDNEPDPVAAMARYQRQNGNLGGMSSSRNTTNNANNTISNGYSTNGGNTTNNRNNTAGGDTTNNRNNTAGGDTTNNQSNTDGNNTTNNGYNTAGNSTTNNQSNTDGNNTTNNGYNTAGNSTTNNQSNTDGNNTTNNGYNTNGGNNTTNNGYNTNGNNTTNNGYNTNGGNTTNNQNDSNSNSDTVNNIQTSPSPVLAFSFETTRFLGQDYVSTDQLKAAMLATEKRATAAGAKAGAAQVASQMRNSPGYRRQVGVR